MPSLAMAFFVYVWALWAAKGIAARRYAARRTHDIGRRTGGLASIGACRLATPAPTRTGSR